MKTKILYFIALIFIFNLAFSQNGKKVDELTREEVLALSYDELLSLPFEDLMKLAEKLGVSVEDLLNMKISVSSQSLMTPRESPGIVSIITETEIKKSGARDIMDLLNLVPGFHFGYDLDGVIGLAARGNWGHEGKILILLDGIEMNENFYSTFQFGNRFPVDQIKRIEIIRGPGSCIYGGYAELGVINIITMDANDLNGGRVSNSHGIMNKGAMHNEISFQTGKQNKDFGFAFGLSASNANRSSLDYYTYDSIHYKLAGTNGRTFSRYSNLALNYKNLKTRFVYDKFSTHAFEYPTNPENSFTGYFGEALYDIKLNDKIVVTPKFNIKQQSPWRMEDTYYVFNKINTRVVGGINSKIDLTKTVSLIAGAELLNDFAEDKSEDTASLFYNGKKKINFSNTSAYLQSYIKTRIVNINLGGRFDHHSKYGNNIAPRLGITRILGKAHFKLLYSQAFRAPAIENININENIKAEKTTVSEFEFGYQLNKKMFITMNLFDIYIKNPIVYQYDSLENEAYVNFKDAGSRGVELEYRFMTNNVNISLNYSYYFSTSNDVEDYKVQDDNTYFQAFPKHKIAMNSWFNLSENITLAPSAIIQGPRYGNFMSNLTSVYKRQDATLFLNIYLMYNNLFTKNLDLSAGVYNLLNNENLYIQAYGESFPALPGYTRDFLIKLSYKF